VTVYANSENALHEAYGLSTEALNQNQLALEAFHDHYFNRYEFAPVSYITLTRTGQIAEINLAGMELLGENHKKLLQQRFSKYALTVDGIRWKTFFLYALKHGGEQNCELLGQRRGGTYFNAYLDCRIINIFDGESALHLTLTGIDVTRLKQGAKPDIM
jgi:PAS domain-containing protein